MTYPVSRLIEMTPLSKDQVRRKLGVSGTEWPRYINGGVSAATAERWAERLGLHPYEVWPELAKEHAANPTARECAHPKCTVEFVPRKSDHKYCCTRCQQNVAKAAWKRRKYAKDAEFREERKAAARARYALERDYIRRQQAAYRARQAS